VTVVGGYQKATIPQRFTPDLELATVSDHDLSLGLTTLGTVAFNGFNNIHALGDTAEHTVLAIEPWGGDGAQEELASVGVRSSIGHGQNTWPLVLQLEVFISKLVAINRLSSGAVVVGEIASLAHELGDDAMEAGALESEALLTGAESAEILGGLGNDVGPQRHNNAAQRLAVGSNIEEAFASRRGWPPRGSCTLAATCPIG